MIVYDKLERKIFLKKNNAHRQILVSTDEEKFWLNRQFFLLLQNFYKKESKNDETFFFHFISVVNSSINILIYCCLSSKFREEGSLVCKRFWRLVTRLTPERLRFGRDGGIELTTFRNNRFSTPKQT